MYSRTNFDVEVLGCFSYQLAHLAHDCAVYCGSRLRFGFTAALNAGAISGETRKIKGGTLCSSLPGTPLPCPRLRGVVAFQGESQRAETCPLGDNAYCITNCGQKASLLEREYGLAFQDDSQIVETCPLGDNAYWSTTRGQKASLPEREYGPSYRRVSTCTVLLYIWVLV